MGYAGSQGYTGSKGESSFTYGPTAPVNPTVGDRWYDSLEGAELVYTDDGTSTQWVEIAASGFLGQTGYTGSGGGGAAAPTAVRVATTTPITVSATTDSVISIKVPGPVAVAVNLPAGTTSTTFTIKDGLGLAAPATPINITAYGSNTIDGSTTATIAAAYSSLTIVFDGTQWIVI